MLLLITDYTQTELELLGSGMKAEQPKCGEASVVTVHTGADVYYLHF